MTDEQQTIIAELQRKIAKQQEEIEELKSKLYIERERLYRYLQRDLEKIFKGDFL